MQAQQNNAKATILILPLPLPLPLPIPLPPPSPPSPSSYSSSYSSSSPPSPPSTSPPPEDITYTFHDLRPESCRPTAEGLTLEATVQCPIGEGESAGDGTSAGNKRPKNEEVGWA